MITRRKGRQITHRCNHCGTSVHLAGTSDFAVARDDARMAGWAFAHVRGRWHAICPSCRNPETRAA